MLRKTFYKTARVERTGEKVSLLEYSEERDAYKIGKIDGYRCRIPLWCPASALTNFENKRED